MSKMHVRTFSFALLSFVLLKAQAALAVLSENHDVWRVDIRPVAQLNVSEQNFPLLKYYRWENSRWQPSDAETFFDTQCAEIPLTIFAPGYSLTTLETTRVGLGIVRTFDPDKPCRVVLWDWFSDKTALNIRRIRRDIRSKIPVANNTADYLALFLQKLEPQSKVCLFGFSFGCRIACQAVETLRRNGQQPEGLRLHLVLSGAATDQGWFAQGQRHSKVPEIAEKILVTYNPDDWVLRFYPLMYHLRCKPAALGFSGVPMKGIPAEYRNRFENINVEPYIGDEHETLYHVRTPVFQSRINSYFFFE